MTRTAFAVAVGARGEVGVTLFGPQAGRGRQLSIRPPLPPNPRRPPIRGADSFHISVKGTQRIEPATVMSYISLHRGRGQAKPQTADRALKALFATGLFSNVRVNWDASASTLNVTVSENPIINQIDYEGNSKVSTKDLEKEVQLARAWSSRGRRYSRTFNASSKFTAATASSAPHSRPANHLSSAEPRRSDLLDS